MRAFLTMLGIIVGIAAVIAVVSTINGTNEQIKQNLIGDGTNTVVVQLCRDHMPLEFSYEEPPFHIREFPESIIDDLSEIGPVVSASLAHVRNYMDNLYCKNIP